MTNEEADTELAPKHSNNIACNLITSKWWSWCTLWLEMLA